MHPINKDRIINLISNNLYRRGYSKFGVSSKHFNIVDVESILKFYQDMGWQCYYYATIANNTIYVFVLPESDLSEYGIG
jgi:hypothetical protein